MVEQRNYQMLIDGEWLDAENDARFDSVNPSSGEVWATFAEASTKDVDRTVKAAYRAFHTGPWSEMSPTARGHCLRRLGDLIIEHGENLGKTECIDTGKLYRETRWQAGYIAEFYYFFAGCADKVTGDTLPIDKPDMFVFTNREPLGVVAAIVPWNSQLFLSAIKIGPALAAGNTVVLKASEHASAAMLEFARLIELAGIPPGVVNVVTGFGDPCGKALTSHPLVSKIAFTGGPAAAQQILSNSAENFAEVSLELGGKSPVIVFDDVDIDSTVNGALGAIFGASGQSCVAGSRLYLQESIADEFLDKMAAGARNIIVGDPMNEDTQMGPLCTPGQIEIAKREVARALEQGGEVMCGGAQPTGLGAQFFQPTIIACPNQQLDIVDTELFGPVLSVLRFKEEEEVIQLANDTRHGLAAGIFTRDGARSLRVARQVRAGIVWINTYRAVSPIAPAGGMKYSGYGRESGYQAIYDYTRPKTVWINTSSEPLGNQFVAR
jgi:(Z)-2-((N-methylformamido)methylene)-5-hydroxybutyrolactone dehydrogenase